MNAQECKRIHLDIVEDTLEIMGFVLADSRLEPLKKHCL